LRGEGFRGKEGGRVLLIQSRDYIIECDGGESRRLCLTALPAMHEFRSCNDRFS
jgi:hypothetical protein